MASSPSSEGVRRWSHLVPPGARVLFMWRKLERQGALTAVSAGEAVVPASDLAAARAEIAKLQRVLGKKTLENEILKEAVEYAAEKKWLARSPLLPGEDL